MAQAGPLRDRSGEASTSPGRGRGNPGSAAGAPSPPATKPRPMAVTGRRRPPDRSPGPPLVLHLNINMQPQVQSPYGLADFIAKLVAALREKEVT